MTEQKKKAKELIDKFTNLSIDILHTDCEGDAAIASGNPTIKDAKILAILCVDEIISELATINNNESFNVSKYGNYWQQVKQDIINYKN